MSLSKILRFSLDDPSSITSLGITLMLMLMGFIYCYYFYSNPPSSATKKEKSSSEPVSTSTSSIPMASSSNSSEPEKEESTLSSFKYDVFISFRGEDTRSKTFVDHLYKALDEKGITTFKDNDEIQEGDGISDDLIKSIEDSKFYIIVFSKNYASSSLFLDVLVKILERRNMLGLTAYTVFYDVEPREVRHQSGAVGDAFSKHENQKARLKEWREALNEATYVGGWELNDFDGHEDEFIKNLVQRLIKKGMNQSLPPLATYFFPFIAMLLPVLNKLVDAICSLPAFLSQLWANYYPRVVEVDLTPGSAFSFIIWCLLVFAGLKSQSVTGFPFKTHPNAIKVPFTSLLIYVFASMAELVVSVARLDHTSVYAIIARLGRISSLCLFVTSLAILLYI